MSCRRDTTLGWLCRAAHLLALLFVWLGAPAVASAWVATGQFNYTDRTYDLGGFTGTLVRPVRYADVQVYDLNTQAVLASGATDTNGNFSINVTDALTRDVGVRAVASTTQTPTLNFSVQDDLNGNAVYAYHDATADVTAHDPLDDVNFGTMTMPAAIGAVATTDWSSQVFNVFDMAVLMADWVAAVDGARPVPFLNIAWNPTSGATGSSYSSGSNTLNLSDDDGYDDANILHEMGHYLEDEFGRSRNTGGSHTIGDDDQDPRLAWSEGVATWFANAILIHGGRPRPDIYSDRDSFGVSGGGGFSYSTESIILGGSCNEQTVNAALYDLIDDAATPDGTPGSDDDTIGGLDGEVWAVIKQMRVRNTPFTSMEDFWDIWLSLGLGNQAALESAFNAHRIQFFPDAFEPNNSPETATLLTVGGAYATNTFYRTGGFPAGDEDWFRFSATAGTYYRIEVNGAADSIFGRPDPEMFLLDTNLNSVLAYNDDPYDAILNTQSSSSAQDMRETCPTNLWRAPVSGTYYVYVRHASYERNFDGRYGTYQLRVATQASPAPAIRQVACQQLLPGQTYQALILGTNFSTTMAVSSPTAGILVSNLQWISPGALTADITAQPGTVNGSYSLTVSNLGVAEMTFAGAITVNSGAQPPVMISEVSLGTDYVEVRNLGTVTATLTGWQIKGGSNATETFTFPTFTLAAGETVRVSDSTGANTASALYDPGTVFNWIFANGNPGQVSLLDNGGRNVDFLRWVTSPVATTHQPPQGTGGAWMSPQFQSPTNIFAIARAEFTALYRTPFGLAKASLTMPAGAGGRLNATDAWEDNDTPRRVRLFGRSATLHNLRISPRPVNTDNDWFGILVRTNDELIVTATFTNAIGNLNLELYAPGNETNALLSATTTGNNETLTLTPAMSSSNGGGVYRLRVFGVGNATNQYWLQFGAPVADTRLTGSALPNPVPLGGAVLVNLALTNVGPAAATGVRLTNLAPAGMQFISATTSQGTLATNGSQVSANLGSLAAGAGAAITVTLTATNPGTFTNLAWLLADTADPLPADNTNSLAILVPVDFDADGLPDVWELANGLSPTNASDAALDGDGDGLSALQEFLAGTDPADPRDALGIISVLLGSSHAVVEFTSETGRSYDVERSDVWPPLMWTPVFTNLAGTGTNILVTNIGAITATNRIYRVRLRP